MLNSPEPTTKDRKLSDLKARTKSAQVELDTVKKAIILENRNLANIIEQKKDVEQQHESADQSLADMKKEILSFEDDIESTRKRRDDLLKEVKESTNELVTLQTKRDDASDELREAKNDLLETRKRIKREVAQHEVELQRYLDFKEQFDNLPWELTTREY